MCVWRNVLKHRRISRPPNRELGPGIRDMLKTQTPNTSRNITEVPEVPSQPRPAQNPLEPQPAIYSPQAGVWLKIRIRPRPRRVFRFVNSRLFQPHAASALVDWCLAWTNTATGASIAQKVSILIFASLWHYARAIEMRQTLAADQCSSAFITKLLHRMSTRLAA